MSQKSAVDLGVWVFATLIAATNAGAGLAQTMGATSTSTGRVVNPNATTTVAGSNKGAEKIGRMSQIATYKEANYNFILPDLPKFTLPELPIREPKTFATKLRIFYPNR